MRKIVLISALFINSLVIAGDILPPPGILYVGLGIADCPYTSIQDAIDAASPNSEIRVTKEHALYQENLTIDKSLTITGGYETCTLAQSNTREVNSRSLVDGGNNAPVLIVLGNSLVLNITGLSMSNGKNLGFFPAGGAMLFGNLNQYNFKELLVIGNQGQLGGGIYIDGESELNLENSRIQLNTADANGGGLFCINNGVVNLQKDSGVINNFAINGAGIFAEECRVNVSTGEYHQSAGSLKGISINHAEKDGGGILLISSELNLTSSTRNGFFGVVNIDNNTADFNKDNFGDGGAIYAWNSTLNISNGYFYRNEVFNGNGGAIFLNDSSVITPTVDSCLKHQKQCVWFESNEAIQDGFVGDYRGGAIFATTNSIVGDSQFPLKAQFIDNRADRGAAIAVTDDSQSEVQNSYFYRNGKFGFEGAFDDASVLYANDLNSKIRVSFSTFADNDTYAVFDIFDHAQVDLRNSIVYSESEIADVLNNSNGFFEMQCNVLHEIDSIGLIGAGDETTISTNPGFINPATDNYHIKYDSVALDLCSNSGLTIIRNDRDGDVRELDMEGIPNGYGAYDAGADEYSDLIFKNDFEGATSGAGG